VHGGLRNEEFKKIQSSKLKTQNSKLKTIQSKLVAAGFSLQNLLCRPAGLGIPPAYKAGAVACPTKWGL
jgi:hypothetical protein